VDPDARGRYDRLRRPVRDTPPLVVLGWESRTLWLPWLVTEKADRSIEALHRQQAKMTTHRSEEIRLA
jgi:hypothetical protein